MFCESTSEFTRVDVAVQQGGLRSCSAACLSWFCHPYVFYTLRVFFFRFFFVPLFVAVVVFFCFVLFCFVNSKGGRAPSRDRWPGWAGRVSVSVVIRSCLGDVSVVSPWCLGGVSVVSWWCLGGFLVVSRW